MNIPPELSDKIQAAINEFVADPDPFMVTPDVSPSGKVDLRKIAAELNVLPVTFDWFECWGIHPDGKITLFKYETPYEIKTETNQKIIIIVFNDAAKKFSELEELAPIRNPESIICEGCDGTGVIKELGHIETLAKSVRCRCGGVGWLPSADPKYLYF